MIERYKIMKIINKIMLAIAIYCTGIDAQQALTTELSQQEATALRLIGAMQESVREYQSLQNQIKNNTTITKINSLKMIFAQSLDQYLTMFGQVYEKKTGLFGGYQFAYHIASKKNQNEPITPNEYTMLINTLQQAAQPSDWGKTINLELSVIKNGLINKKTLTLQEIINGIKQVPLPTNYSITNIAMSAAAIAALAIGAAIVYNSTMKQPATPPVATILPPAQQVLQSPATTPGAEPIKPEIAHQVTPKTNLSGLDTPQVKHASTAPGQGQTIVATSAGKISKSAQESELLKALRAVNNFLDHPHEDDGRFSTDLIDGIGSAVEKASDMLPNIPIDISPEARETGKLVKNLTVDMYTHAAKTMMDLPGDIYDVTTQVTKNLINPSPELQDYNNAYQEWLEEMSPEDRFDFYENERVGSVTGDKEFVKAAVGKAAELSMSGFLLKPFAKPLITKAMPALTKQLSTTTMENVSKIGEKVDAMTTGPASFKLFGASLGSQFIEQAAQYADATPEERIEMKENIIKYLTDPNRLKDPEAEKMNSTVTGGAISAAAATHDALKKLFKKCLNKKSISSLKKGKML